MSRAWTWRNAILASKLPATTKHVLMVISCHMNDMGEGCYPSTKRLAELGSLSERSVCTHIDDAEKAGWLKVTKHGFNGQRWARHEYSPLWPQGTESPSAPLKKGTEPDAKGTEPDDGKALNNVQSNISGEILTENPILPLTPSGGMWESDSVFMDLVQRYSAINPDRADCRKAWELWQTEKLADDIDAILKALPVYASGEQWQREGGRYVPSLSKWLSERGWKNVAAGLPTPEQLRERERIGKAGVDAYARIQNAKQWGREPDPADVEAVRRWEEMKAGRAS